MITEIKTDSTGKKYKLFNGTCYNENTPDEVIQVIDNAKTTGKKLKLFYGDTETGRDWMETYDTTGTIGRSTGEIKIPLLIKTTRSHGGGAILTDCIVKIRDAKTGIVLYKHPKYQQPKIEITEADERSKTLGYTHATMVNGEIHGLHKSLKSAEILKNKLL